MAKVPPEFRRAPRLRPPIPETEVEIEPPPALPGMESGNLLAAGLSTAVSAAISPTSLVMRFPYLLSQIGGKRKFKKWLQQREELYHHYLAQKQAELVKLAEAQQYALLLMDPAPQECLRLVQELDPNRMWERTLQDDDFLDIRLGLGSAPFSVTIKPPPQPEVAMEIDPLVIEARKLAESFATIPDVPVKLPLFKVGIAGVAGPRREVLNSIRAMLLHLTTHHAPTEVKLVLFYPHQEMREWGWSRWLPHVWDEERKRRYIAHAEQIAHELASELFHLLRQRELRLQATASEKQLPELPVWVFVMGEEKLTQRDALVHFLLTRGPSAGVYSIFLANTVGQLPKECRAIVDVGGAVRLRMRASGGDRFLPFTPDVVPVPMADTFARSLAPVRLQTTGGHSSLPEVVTLFELLGVRRVEELNVPELWKNSRPDKSLAAPIGIQTGGDKLEMDLHERAHGPHGLGAGATGSGKSELLQTMIVSMATRFHPHEVAFLLIDYKGGGMANAFKQLPHLVGTITNLEGSLALRALIALRAELRRRQKLFDKAGVNHIDKYQQLYREHKVTEPMPHLVIIADEFAELKMNQPEFMGELISAVRVGRSLGVHLILTTQKPAGVVDEQIWGNARFRFCLRVERPEDSRDVLKRPDAANITLPGRAYYQVGNNELFVLFQSGYGGAPYHPDSILADDKMEAIKEVWVDGRRKTLRKTSKAQKKEEKAPTQLEILVEYLAKVAREQGIKPVRGPWLPPLPRRIAWQELIKGKSESTAYWNGQRWAADPTRMPWVEPIIGLLDAPDQQWQGPLQLPLGKEGHLVIYGAPGSGKTVLLQTLITSLAYAHSPDTLNFYILDFGSRILKMFEALPHTGDVILLDEEEKFHRLLQFISEEMERRKHLFSQAGVGTLEAYRRQAQAERVPAIVIILDGYMTLHETYNDDVPTIASLIREGGNLGIHWVMTANRPLPVKLATNIKLTIALQQADERDYKELVGKTNVIPAPYPGRGLTRWPRPLEFQTATPAPGEEAIRWNAKLKEIIGGMAQSWQGPCASPVPTLPAKLYLEALLPSTQPWETAGTQAWIAPVGVDVNSLRPVQVHLDKSTPHFIITGPPQGGKTTLLQTWLLALATRYPPERLQIYIVDSRQGYLEPLEELPHVPLEGYATVAEMERVQAMLQHLQAEIKEREKGFKEAQQQGEQALQAFRARHPAIVLAIDHFDALKDEMELIDRKRKDEIEKALETFVLTWYEGTHMLVAGGEVERGYERWLKALRTKKTGFFLGGDRSEVPNFFGARIRHLTYATQPRPGLGFLLQGGKWQQVAIALPYGEAETMERRIQAIKER